MEKKKIDVYGWEHKLGMLRYKFGLASVKKTIKNSTLLIG